MTRATTAFAIVVLGLVGPAAVVSTAAGQPAPQPAQPAAAAATQPKAVAVVPPPPPPPAAAVEPAPASFKRHGSQAASSPTSQPAGATRASTAAPQVGVARVFGALAVVIGLIFVLRWVFRRLAGGIGGHRPSQVVRVLGRNVISPRQQVLVLQVGRRVVVVGDSGQHMSPLCEITDAGEVADLVAQLRVERVEPLARTFSSLFGRADAKYDPPPPPSSLAPRTSGPEAQGDPDEDDYPRALPPGGGEDANVVAATREEIDGLMNRVRGLSQQFRRSP